MQKTNLTEMVSIAIYSRIFQNIPEYPEYPRISKNIRSSHSPLAGANGILRIFLNANLRIIYHKATISNSNIELSTHLDNSHLHMDEQTPHLHVTVVPIVTIERKRKASEASATKRYRTKPKSRARLSADNIISVEPDTLLGYRSQGSEKLDSTKR